MYMPGKEGGPTHWAVALPCLGMAQIRPQAVAGPLAIIKVEGFPFLPQGFCLKKTPQG